MLNIPAIRWGKPYESLEKAEVAHFATGEPIASVSQAGGGIIKRDMRTAHKARERLREIPCADLIEMVGRAGELYENGTLAIGDGMQSPDDFVHQQSASTGLPEHMCRKNMGKNSFVLNNMQRILDCLTRGLDLEILTRGWGEEGRDVEVSFQAQAPVLAAVLPSNSPGVHTLWLPVIPLQLGLVLKPGPQEPWTPYRMFAAFVEAGVPPEVFCLYPGEAEAGAAVLDACDRAMIFGGTPTVERYRGNPKVQAHGPGFSKILLGDDMVDRWEEFIDLMAESIFINSGRGCINCSGVWASRHTEEIAQALAERLGPVEALPPDDENAGLAAFTVPGRGRLCGSKSNRIWQRTASRT
jgi:acyl-CoA reductase-like NAD-dependent aldehyde dehydrogenase